MSTALTTNVTELGDSRVRIEVTVPAQEIEGRVERKAQLLGRELKLPGFRKGKVPAPLVIQRIGREAVLDQAVRDALSGWYAEAIGSADVVPVGDPQLDLDELPAQGQELRFSIEIGVLPTAQLGNYDGLEVPRREPLVEDGQIDREVEAMRERLARLETAERPAAKGDFVVIDYTGSLAPAQAGEAESGETESGGDESGDDQSADDRSAGEPLPGGEGRDQLVELGAGNLIPGFEEGLVGAGAGDSRDVQLTFPDDYPNEQLAGRDATFAVTVKEVKLKQLPEVDDDLAIDAGFDNLQELRDDISARLVEADEARIEAEFRQAALDAAVSEATVQLTPELIKARAQEMWERMLHTLSHRGVSREAYLQIAGREEAEILAEAEDEAELALKREAVLTAIVIAEAIDPSEDDLLQAVAPTAEREGVEAPALLQSLRAKGRLEDLREDVAARMAIELIAERSTPISVGQAQAREQLWTPEQAGQPQGAAAGGGADAPGKLWTPTERSQAS